MSGGRAQEVQGSFVPLWTLKEWVRSCVPGEEGMVASPSGPGRWPPLGEGPMGQKDMQEMGGTGGGASQGLEAVQEAMSSSRGSTLHVAMSSCTARQTQNLDHLFVRQGLFPQSFHEALNPALAV